MPPIFNLYISAYSRYRYGRFIFRRISTKKGFSWVELLVVVTIVSIVVAIGIPGLKRLGEAQKKAKAQQESLSRVDYVVLGEGRFDKVEYVFNGEQYTVVDFQDGHNARMIGVNSISCHRGDKIRISQRRLGAGTEFEKLENSYKIELLEEGAK